MTDPAAAQAPNLSMSFSAPTISAGDTTRLSFRIRNSSPRTNSLVAFGNSLPAGLVIASQPGVLNSCGGVVSASPGASVFRISNVIVDPRSSCTVSFNVTATSAGVMNLTTTQVTGSTGRGSGTSAAITVYAPRTAVASISPASGTTFGSTRVTITGTDFTGATAVTIGGVAVTRFTVVNPSTITAITPAHDAGTVDVVVWTPRGTATGRALYTYDSIVPAVAVGGAIAAGLAVGAAALAGGGSDPSPVYPGAAPPTVTAITPSSGTVMGGTGVTIKGNNLTGATTVRIGGVPAASFAIVNSTTVNAITSARAAGAADVSVSTPGGTGMAPALYNYVVPAPTVTSVGPGSGTTLGGTSITITGNHLTGATAVTIGGTAATSFAVVNDTTITAITPVHAAGIVNVAVTTAGGTGTGAALYSYVTPAPTMTSVDPASGSTLGGTTVTITGTNLTGATTVTFGGVPASSFSVVNSTTISAVAPAHAAGLVNVAVTTPGGTVTLASSYTYVTPAPTITTILPTSGTALGGTTVTITGTNLTGASAVTFGGVPASSITVVNASTITAVTPAHAAGLVDVVITAPGGSVTAASSYTYVAPPPTITLLNPSSGPTLGGTTVTITGSNLSGATSVMFGGTAATSLTVVNDTTITATTPAHAAGTVDVAITTPGGTMTGTGLFTYVTPAPTVTAINPISGTTAGGTEVVITGTNLTGASAVTFGGVPATSFTVVNATTVNATTPAHAAGAVAVVVTTPGGNGTGAGMFTYVTPAPLMTSIGPTSGPAVGGTTVTITGANLLGTTAVIFGGIPATSFTVVNANTIVAMTPPRSAGPADIVITTPGGTGASSLVFNYMLQTTATSASSSANPSVYGQAVTLTATVGGSGGTPSGTVTFRDGATSLGTATLNGAGQATLTTSSLSVGSHSITAAYGGSGSFTASTSAALIQVVGIPADSARLQALQAGVTKLVAQSSGQTMSGAVDSAIADGFSDGGDFMRPSDNGVRFNFPVDPERRSTVDERVGSSFAALGQNVYKAPRAAPAAYIPREWLAWAEVRGTGWSTSVQSGDIRGGQVNALVGVTRKVTPDFLLGVFGGYETFDYSSQTLNGTLKGDGWTFGGYLGWRFLPGLRFDASLARSGISYDGVAGIASGSFTGQRWFVSGGLTGTYKTVQGMEIEPSARVYALWESESGCVDNLGIQHPDRNFSTGRASAGAKFAYPWLWSSGTTLTPYVGVYGDYYFNKDDAVALGAPFLLPAEHVDGFAGRFTSGLALSFAGGPRLSVGGEIGGIGNDFLHWSVRARGAVPF
ncbi:MAG: IPT/TIG domain-containing protein [Xanthobacteraceae bacterium]